MYSCSIADPMYQFLTVDYIVSLTFPGEIVTPIVEVATRPLQDS